VLQHKGAVYVTWAVLAFVSYPDRHASSMFAINRRAKGDSDIVFGWFPRHRSSDYDHLCPKLCNWSERMMRWKHHEPVTKDTRTARYDIPVRIRRIVSS
jgi:hypothetical protein